MLRRSPHGSLAGLPPERFHRLLGRVRPSPERGREVLPAAVREHADDDPSSSSVASRAPRGRPRPTETPAKIASRSSSARTRPPPRRSTRGASGRASTRRGSAERSRPRASGAPSRVAGKRLGGRDDHVREASLRRAPAPIRVPPVPRPRRTRRAGRAPPRSPRPCLRSGRAGSPRCRTGTGRPVVAAPRGISSATRTAPFEPSSPGEKTISAPKISSRRLRSSVTLSGRTQVSL